MFLLVHGGRTETFLAASPLERAFAEQHFIPLIALFLSLLTLKRASLKFGEQSDTQLPFEPDAILQPGKVASSHSQEQL